MTDDIQAGDMVQLISGGQKMTVARLENNDGEICAVCGWTGRGTVKLKTVPLHMLKRVEPGT